MCWTSSSGEAMFKKVFRSLLVRGLVVAVVVCRERHSGMLGGNEFVCGGRQKLLSAGWDLSNERPNERN